MGQQSKTGNLEIDVKIIGFLISAETSLHVFPSDEKMIDSALQVLNKIPGILHCNICTKGVLHSIDSLVAKKCNSCELLFKEVEEKKNEKCKFSNLDGFDVLSLKTAFKLFGFLKIEVEDSGKYQLYAPFVNNFANAISIVMENRWQKEQLSIQNKELLKHRSNLEKQVEERTASLEKSERLLSMSQRISHVGGWEYNLENDSMFWTDEMYNIHGFEPDEINSNAKSLISKSIECYNPEDRPLILEAFERCIKDGQGYDLEYPITRYSGEKIWIRTTARPVISNGRIVRVVGNFVDITNFKQAEEQINSSLKEKETLLHEIHHRVKNNMQVINSLLKLQSNSIEDEQIKEILKDSQSRVYAMAAVHETLHGSENLSEIDLKSYLQKVINSIFQTYSTDNRKVKLNSNVKNSPVSINQAYPLGLVINELISNSLKYAFPDEREGEITIKMEKLENELELIVTDNGVGIPKDFDWKNSSSLGLKLVHNLVENQLDGSIEMENKNGTKFTIKFNIET
jgi:PAS domain S-box-containing protein